MTIETDIQFLKELALEVIHDDLDNDQISKNPDEVKCTWHPCGRQLYMYGVHQTSSYANSLAVMTWTDREEHMMDCLANSKTKKV